MGLATGILSALSRPVQSGEYVNSDYTESPLKLLEQEFDLQALAGKTVVDFGCGFGMQSIALHAQYGCSVIGVENNTRTLAKARELERPGVRFMERMPDEPVDAIVSQDAMEHFSDPEYVLALMARGLKPDGKILMTFGPPWLAPYGSHMHFFCRVPWLNVLFPESAVMAVRSRYRDDGARRYEEVESGLNKMTLGRFETLVRRSGLKIETSRYHTIKKLPVVGVIPIMREFFVNQVSVVLAKV